MSFASRRPARVTSLLLIASLFVPAAAAQNVPPPPSQFLKFEVGADRQLADYKQIVSYFKALAAASKRVEIENLGPTTLGNDLIIAVISSEENLKNKKRYQEIARQLADPRGKSKEQIEALVHEGKAIVLVTCNIHATEIGASQMAMEWAYALATAQDAATKSRLDNVILLLMPSINPDGQIMVTDWYRKYVGTRFEGGPMPYLYHHYVGHDNNRDWYMLTQKETKAINHAVYHEWYPSIWLDEHQMGETGPRIFVPPYAEPYSPSINPLIFRGVNLIGTTMAFRLEEQHKSGVIHSFDFDAYWPGGTRNTGWWKNIFGLLTETASARIATPVNIPATELAGGPKGLVEYGPQVSFPNPWPGGRWRLRDVMDYERVISDALLERAAANREDYLRGVASMAQDAIAAAASPSDHFEISAASPDPVVAAKLAHLMSDHGVEVFVDERGDYVIPAGQPYGKFVSEMLGVQRYPKTKLVPGSNFIPPYDMTAWSLPLLMGVPVARNSAPVSKMRPLTEKDWPQGEAVGKGAFKLLKPEANEAAIVLNELAAKPNTNISIARETFKIGPQSFAAGTAIVQGGEDVAELAIKHHLDIFATPEAPKVPTAKLRAVRTAIYQPTVPGGNIDEGWTRWVLEQYGFAPKPIDSKTVRAGNLNAAFDAIVFPSLSRDMMFNGPRPPQPGAARPAAAADSEGGPRYRPDLPPDFQDGLGREGVAALKDFVAKGGTIITLAAAGDLIIDDFNLPVRNSLARVRSEEFLAPGSLLNIELDPSHPVAYGMPHTAAAFVDSGIAYQTSLPMADTERSVVAWYPKDAEDILASGWIRGAERLERKAAVVAFQQGKGKVVMIGFRAQHRGQTEGTFKLLFNAIRWAGLAE
ncbi:MAG TPA: M14 family metallopeptidase [Terriglobales bacterium]|nr:M14 family metallopeptidase [Terriglobales bacterium]